MTGPRNKFKNYTRRCKVCNEIHTTIYKYGEICDACKMLKTTPAKKKTEKSHWTLDNP